MKKITYKKQKVKQQANKVQNPLKKSKQTIILTAGILVNLCLILVIIALLILTKSIFLNRTLAEDAHINFSYFTKRPDLLSSSKALVVYDANSNVILLSRNKDLRFSPASTVKVMTALVALEKFDPETVLRVNSLDYNPDSSKMGLFLNEKISVKNLIYGMLLPSGADAADVLAENYPGGEEVFVDRMNEKAKEMGMKNTHFVDPAGYDDRNYSTASDLVKLGANALKNPLISQIVKTKKIIVYSDDKTIIHRLQNLNELLEINGVNGVKTGFTNEAEGVLITSFINNGNEYVMVVLGSKDRFFDTNLLIKGIIEDLKNESKL